MTETPRQTPTLQNTRVIQTHDFWGSQPRGVRIPRHTIEEAEGFYRTVDHRIAEDSIREQYFAKEVLEAVNSTNAKSVSILCGDMHVDFLKEILEARGKQVETNRELSAEKYWE